MSAPSQTKNVNEARSAPDLAVLTDREREVLSLIGQGMSLSQIAAHLLRSIDTVKSHRRSIAKKLGTADRVALVRIAVRAGLATLDGVHDGTNGSRGVREKLAEGLDLTSLALARLDGMMKFECANSAMGALVGRVANGLEGCGLPEVFGAHSEIVALCVAAAAPGAICRARLEHGAGMGSKKPLLAECIRMRAADGGAGGYWLCLCDVGETSCSGSQRAGA